MISGTDPDNVAGVELVIVGRCLDCGDDWPDRDPIVVCPECGSLNVVELPGSEATS